MINLDALSLVYKSNKLSLETRIKAKEEFKEKLASLFARKKGGMINNRLEFLRELDALNVRRKEKHICLVCKAEIASIEAIEERNPHFTPLYLTRTGHVEALREKILADRGIVDEPVVGKTTLLHEAVKASQFNVCRLLMEFGANIHALDRCQRRPFSYAKLIWIKNLLGNPHFFYEKLIEKGVEALDVKKFFKQDRSLCEKVKHIFNLETETHRCAFANAKVYHRKSITTLLHVAVDAQQPEVVQLLIERGANPNMQDSRNRTPIEVALSMNQRRPNARLIACIEHLIHGGTSLLNCEDYKHTVEAVKSAFKVWEFVEQQKTDALKDFLSKKGQEVIVTARFSEGKTALHRATELGNIEIAAILVRHSRKVLDVVDESGNDPLQVAVMAKEKEHVSLFLQSGAHIQSRNHEGKAALEIARTARSPDILELIEGATDLLANAHYILEISMGLFAFETDDAKQQAVERGQAKISQILANPSLYAAVNARSNEDKTTLHFLCENLDAPLDLIKVAVEAGARLDEYNYRGATPLHNIAFRRIRSPKQDLEYLRSQFGQFDELINLPDRQEQKTPTMLAAFSGNVEFVKWALDKKLSSVHDLDQHGNTSLSLAVRSKDDEARAKVVDLLLESGADTEVRNNHGQTPLLLAAQRGKVNEIRRGKLGNGLRAEDNERRPIFHQVCRYGSMKDIFAFFNPEVMRYFAEHNVLDLLTTRDQSRDGRECFYEVLAHNKKFKLLGARELNEDGKVVLAMCQRIYEVVFEKS